MIALEAELQGASAVPAPTEPLKSQEARASAAVPPPAQLASALEAPANGLPDKAAAVRAVEQAFAAMQRVQELKEQSAAEDGTGTAEQPPESVTERAPSSHPVLPEAPAAEVSQDAQEAQPARKKRRMWGAPAGTARDQAWCKAGRKCVSPLSAGTVLCNSSSTAGRQPRLGAASPT